MLLCSHAPPHPINNTLTASFIMAKDVTKAVDEVARQVSVRA